VIVIVCVSQDIREVEEIYVLKVISWPFLFTSLSPSPFSHELARSLSRSHCRKYAVSESTLSHTSYSGDSVQDVCEK
jgi:hypothetical protein